MSEVELRTDVRFAWREARPEVETGPPVLLLHGYPESSLMWEPLMTALAAAGHRAIAPDLYGLGDSPDQRPATFERNRAAVADFHASLDLGRVVVVVHDWGGFVGLAWACEHPDLVEALVISDTGFFADGKWHGLADAVRGPDGEAFVGALDRGAFEGLLRDSFDDATIDAYWRPFTTGAGQRATLDFYRSMDFAKLAEYDGRLAELGVPTLLLWGADDPYAPVSGAHRFAREIPGASLVALEGAGHFVFDQEPDRCVAAVLDFLSR